MQPDVEQGTQITTGPATGAVTIEPTPSLQNPQIQAKPAQAQIAYVRDPNLKVKTFFDHFSARQKASGADKCVFIAWSTGGKYLAVDVPIAYPANDVDAFQRMQDAYYRAQGRWRRFVPFYGLVDVREATVWHITMLR
jgi:hypothetical protein